jgi:3-oxoacyl-[acyl-carrier protein] reductase
MRFDGNHSPLAGKTALITGGTSGVGLRIAERLARRGATVVVNGRDAARCEEATEKLRAITKSVSYAVGDCSDYEQVRSVVGAATAINERLDILISAGAAGTSPAAPFAELSPAELDSGFRSRFFPRIFPVHAALPGLQRSQGSVVLLTTDAARYPTPGESLIGAVGASLILMVKTLGKELARSQVRINAVAMTLTTDTPSWDRIFGTQDFQSNLFAKAVGRFPFGRPPSAGEVADVAVFLASDEAAQITGQTVSVNGGLSFGGW